jgi:hypothetical protein
MQYFCDFSNTFVKAVFQQGGCFPKINTCYIEASLKHPTPYPVTYFTETLSRQVDHIPSSLCSGGSRQCSKESTLHQCYSERLLQRT